ncbi:MAG TPA: NapC/NirT family cytochrome c [Pontiella sp.]
MGKTTEKSLIHNLISMLGIILAATGFIACSIMISIDIRNHFENPYTGILTYAVLPGILAFGLFLIVGGILLEKRRRNKNTEKTKKLPIVDLNDKRQFSAIIIIVIVAIALAALSMVGGYQAYHFTESVEFCGKTCHKVMKPEYVAFQNSPHANTHCTKCHIGPGADFFVKSKINGMYQVYSSLFDKYNRPIPTPLHNLRPAKETCYTCHWPEKFFGSVEFKRTYFRADEENTPWTIQMLMKVGGGDTKRGRDQGIHWHMAADNKIEYIATDEKRLEIPWVRITKADGTETVYQTKDTKKQLTPEQIAEAEIRTMDCLDCHNRPAHQFLSPERALNEVMTTGQVSSDIPEIKRNGITALTGEYKTESEALQAIKEKLEKAYPDGGPEIEQAIQAIQNVYAQNMFPEMKVSWEEYPDHIGHMISPGCFRCHNGDHQDDQGNVISRDCDSCHSIISQGPGTAPTSINTGGIPFQHPEDIDEEWKETRCDECHTGVPVM